MLHSETSCNILGHISVRDITEPDNVITIVDKNNAIHFGNFSTKMAEAIIGRPSAFITYMAFGNGGVTVESNGQITYKSANTSLAKDPSAALYNTTFIREIINYNTVGQTDLTREANAGGGVNNYEDVTFVVTLDRNMPDTQMLFDLANGSNDSTLTNTEFVFNEIALYTGLRDLGNSTSDSELDAFFSDITSTRPTLVTHVVFHPVQKSTNRVLEITYKLRIILG
jgi:hypothetical protein